VVWKKELEAIEELKKQLVAQDSMEPPESESSVPIVGGDCGSLPPEAQDSCRKRKGELPDSKPAPAPAPADSVTHSGDPSYKTKDAVQSVWLALISLEGLICEVEHGWLLFPDRTKDEITGIFSKLIGTTTEQTAKVLELKARYEKAAGAVKQIDWECGCILSHGKQRYGKFENTKIRGGYGSMCAKWEEMPGSPFEEDCEKDGQDFCGCSWCYVHADCGTGRKSKVFKDSYWSECHDKDLPDDSKIAAVKQVKEEEEEEEEESKPQDTIPVPTGIDSASIKPETKDSDEDASG